MRLFLVSLILCLHAFTAYAGKDELPLLEDRVEQLRARLAADGISGSSVLARARGGESREWLAATDARLVELQGAYDGLVQAELEKMLGLAEEIVGEIQLDPAAAKGNEESFQRLSAHARKFRESAGLYGTGKDVKRKEAYQNFFADFKRLSDRLQNRAFSQRLKAKMLALVALVKQALALAPGIPAFLKDLYFPGEKDELISSSLYRWFRDYGRRAGYQVAVEGREKIPLLRNKKTLNIYAPTHRLAMNDAVIMANVAPADSLLFMAPRNFLPGPLASQLEGVPGLVAVGKGENPVAVALATLEKTGKQNIFIYPEGGLPAGVMENQPVREKFGTSLIAGLRAAGYEVNIIPVSYRNSARLLNRATTEAGSKELLARIHEAIPDRVLAEWEKYDPAFLTRYLRQVHMEGLETDGRQLLGMLRPGELANELGRYLGGCAGHFANLAR